MWRVESMRITLRASKFGFVVPIRFSISISCSFCACPAERKLSKRRNPAHAAQKENNTTQDLNRTSRTGVQVQVQSTPSQFSSIQVDSGQGRTTFQDKDLQIVSGLVQELLLECKP